jgi:hypothetical protein
MYILKIRYGGALRKEAAAMQWRESARRLDFTHSLPNNCDA